MGDHETPFPPPQSSQQRARRHTRIRRRDCYLQRPTVATGWSREGEMTDLFQCLGVCLKKKKLYKNHKKNNSNIKIKGMITCWMISNDNSRFSESMSAFFRQKTNATAVEPLENVAMRTLQRLFVSALFDHPIWKLKIKKVSDLPMFQHPQNFQRHHRLGCLTPTVTSKP